MRLIDLNHFGVARAIGVWQIGDALVDCGPTSCVERLLEELDDWRPRALLLTHIHLDHAGAAGTLAGLWPDVEIYVHERGARHLVDPERLNDSVRRILGDLTETLWGDVEPVPPQRLRPLVGGEQLGDIAVAYTPGHASHHVAFLHGEGCAFVGDAVGVRISPPDVVVPHAPPPDIDLPAWERTLDIARDWQPAALALPHFGLVNDALDHLEEFEKLLHRDADRARDGSVDEFVTQREPRLAGLDEPTQRAYRHAAPAPHSHAGLVRYWDERPEAEASAAGSGR